LVPFILILLQLQLLLISFILFLLKFQLLLQLVGKKCTELRQHVRYRSIARLVDRRLDNRRHTSFCRFACRIWLVWCLTDFISLIFHKVTRCPSSPRWRVNSSMHLALVVGIGVTPYRHSSLRRLPRVRLSNRFLEDIYIYIMSDTSERITRTACLVKRSHKDGVENAHRLWRSCHKSF